METQGRHGSRSPNSRVVSRASSLLQPSPDALRAHPSLLSFQEPGLSCRAKDIVLLLLTYSKYPAAPKSPVLSVDSGKTPSPLTHPLRHLRPHSPDTLPSERQVS